MTRWHIVLEYDGTTLLGWQKQKDGPSAQSLLEKAIHSFSGEEVSTMAAGRTDAGVHALGMSAHFDLLRETSPFILINALNAYLRFEPLKLLSAEIVPDDFHARFSAINRHYLYRILNRESPAVLDLTRVYHVRSPLDIEAMNIGASYLMGHHDFTSFRASHCQSNSPYKTLDSLTIQSIGNEIHIEAKAKSFLHHQVRNMVGTLVMVGKGKIPPIAIKEILEAKDRRIAGATAPAHALYFVRAVY